MEMDSESARVPLSPPKREVFAPADLPKWEKSEAYEEYIGFINALNEAVQGKKTTSVYPINENVKKILEVLEQMDKWIDETPPIEQPQRFGNKAFRTWFEKLRNGSSELLKKALPAEFHYSIPEVEVYLVEGVGNSTRIDYGSGHEMSFIMFVYCLFKIKYLREEDYTAAVLSIFNRYLILMRKLQLTYRMEPAGSHGVWSLDDYQFVPFIWGSSQLIEHQRLPPKSFPNEDIVVSFAKDYMFLGCIQFILKVKTGPFAEHSNQLWNISGVQTWAKVNAGLIKMYKAEVLAKFPVIQHVLFGTLLPIEPANRTASPK